MAHRNDPSELYVVQDSQRRDDSIEGYGRLRGRTNSRPIYGSDALKPAAAKRDPSAGFTKKAIATGPKKKRKPPKVPWKKPKDMPKRPLSAYNLFFAYERERLLQGATPPNSQNNSPTSLEDDCRKCFGSPDVSGDPSGPRRRHLKTSGIGFANLAKNVSSKWKNLHQAKRSVFEAKAAIEKEKYLSEVHVWRTKKKDEASLELAGGGSSDKPDNTICGKKPSILMARRASDPLPTSAESGTKRLTRRQSTNGITSKDFESSHIASDNSSSGMQDTIDGESMTSMPEDLDTLGDDTALNRPMQRVDWLSYYAYQHAERDYHRTLSTTIQDLNGTSDRLRSCEEMAAEGRQLDKGKEESPTTASLHSLRFNLDSETVTFLANLKFDEKIEEV